MSGCRPCSRGNGQQTAVEATASESTLATKFEDQVDEKNFES